MCFMFYVTQQVFLQAPVKTTSLINIKKHKKCKTQLLKHSAPGTRRELAAVLIPLWPRLTCARRLVGSWWGRSWRGIGPGVFPVKRCTQIHPSLLRRPPPLSDRFPGPCAPSSWPASSWIWREGERKGQMGENRDWNMFHFWPILHFMGLVLCSKKHLLWRAALSHWDHIKAPTTAWQTVDFWEFKKSDNNTLAISDFIFQRQQQPTDPLDLFLSFST